MPSEPIKLTKTREIWEELNRKLEKTRVDLAIAQNEYKRLSSEIEEWKANRKQKDDQLLVDTQKYDNLLLEIELLQSKKIEIQDEYNDLIHNSKDKAEKAREELNSAEDEYNTTALIMEDNIRALKKTKQKYEKEIEEVTKDIKNKKDALKMMMDELETGFKTLLGIKERENKLDKDKKKWKKELDKIKKEMVWLKNETDKNRAEYEDTIASCKRRTNKLNNDINLLEKEKYELIKFNSQYKTLKSNFDEDVKKRQEILQKRQEEIDKKESAVKNREDILAEESQKLKDDKKLAVDELKDIENSKNSIELDKKKLETEINEYKQLFDKSLDKHKSNIKKLYIEETDLNRNVKESKLILSKLGDEIIKMTDYTIEIEKSLKSKENELKNIEKKHNEILEQNKKIELETKKMLDDAKRLRAELDVKDVSLQVRSEKLNKYSIKLNEYAKTLREAAKKTSI